MKPPGIRMTINGDGIKMGVTQPSSAEDAIWRAVQEALLHGYTPEQFRAEAAEAWAYELDQQKQHAREVL